MSLTIDSDFDGGNIRCLTARAPDRIRLEIVPDAGGEFFQWFYFSVRGAAGKDCVLRIENAGGVTYPDGWRDYRAVASEDGEDWPRVATEYDGKVLTIRHRPVGDEVRFAYFAPYPMERHAELIERMATSSFVTARRLGQTLDGAPLDLLEIGGARAADLLDHRAPASWRDHGRVVDGGFSRTAAGPRRSARPRAAREGAVLRGAQHEPRRQPPRAPQDQRGGRQPQPRLGGPQHGAEPGGVPGQRGDGPHRRRLSASMSTATRRLPYNFIAGPEGIPSYTDALAQKLAHFQAVLVAANPDFQTKYGYPPTPPGKANLRICANLRGGDLWLPRHDPGNAVQGRGQRARSPRRLVASALPPTRAEFLGGARRRHRRGALS